MQRVEFTIPGRPVPKPRMTQRDRWLKPARPCVARYRVWRGLIQAFYLRAIDGRVNKIKGKVAMGFKFYLSTSGGDLDNYIKAIKDCLNGWAYVDDKQVCKYVDEPEKVLCGKGEERAEIVVEEISYEA